MKPNDENILYLSAAAICMCNLKDKYCIKKLEAIGGELLWSPVLWLHSAPGTPWMWARLGRTLPSAGVTLHPSAKVVAELFSFVINRQQFISAWHTSI